MDIDGARYAAIAETTSFLHYFSELPDHRQPGKVDYPLPEVLLLVLLAVLAGAEAFTDIARFGERKIELLRRFRPYANGLARSSRRYLRNPGCPRLPALLRGLSRGADQHAGRGHRDRWQNVAALVSDQGLERGDPHGLRLRGAATYRAGPGEGEREVERDHR